MCPGADDACPPAPVWAASGLLHASAASAASAAANACLSTRAEAALFQPGFAEPALSYEVPCDAPAMPLCMKERGALPLLLRLWPSG